MTGFDVVVVVLAVGVVGATIQVLRRLAAGPDTFDRAAVGIMAAIPLGVACAFSFCAIGLWLFTDQSVLDVMVTKAGTQPTKPDLCWLCRWW